MTAISCVRGPGSELPSLFDAIGTALDGAAPGLVLVFASPKTELGPVLSSAAARFPGARTIGASSSGEFTQDGDGEGTVALFAVAGDYKVFAGFGEGLSKSPSAAVAAALAGQPAQVHGYPHRTGILLLDPLAGHSEEAALLLAAELGDAPIVGGAAGDDLAMKKTFVGVEETSGSDAVVVATIFSKSPLGIGVKHGHAPLSDKLTVTRADGSVVLEIDGRPAFEVWLERTRDRARALGIDPMENPGAYLLRFEAGLRVGHGFKVRAPLAPKEGGGILFATPLDEGTVFQIMESDASAQIDSAVEAAHAARRAVEPNGVAGALVFDCICRNLILGQEYAPMLGRISEALGGAPLSGFETYGEIAMNAHDMSGFHNTTTVVLAFPDDMPASFAPRQ